MSSIDDNIKLMIKWLLCMANGGGGSIVLGVADKNRKSGEGVPDTDLYAIAKRIYERTDPHLMPHPRKSTYPTERKNLIMHVLPGIHHIRLQIEFSKPFAGKDCIPFYRNPKKTNGF